MYIYNIILLQTLSIFHQNYLSYYLLVTDKQTKVLQVVRFQKFECFLFDKEVKFASVGAYIQYLHGF